MEPGCRPSAAFGLQNLPSPNLGRFRLSPWIATDSDSPLVLQSPIATSRSSFGAPARTTIFPITFHLKDYTPSNECRSRVRRTQTAVIATQWLQTVEKSHGLGAKHQPSFKGLVGDFPTVPQWPTSNLAAHSEHRAIHTCTHAYTHVE